MSDDPALSDAGPVDDEDLITALETTEVSTDLAALALFDKDVLAHRVREPGSWWRQGPLVELPEIEEGRAVLLHIGKEGTFRIAARLGELTEAERALFVGEIQGLGVVTQTGELFCGIGERIPGDGGGDRLHVIPGTGGLLTVRPGAYAVRVCVLHWRHKDEFFDEDNEVLPGAPPDFVFLIGPRPAADDPEAPDLPMQLPTLLSLIPRKEAQGRAHVPQQVKRRRPVSEPEPRRRRSSSASPPPPVAPVVRVPAPSDVARFSPAMVRGAFDEVLTQELAQPSAPGANHTHLLWLRPKNRDLMATEISVEAMEKKLTRVRENLRVLEAKLNGNSNLEWSERAELEVPLTRVYQSLDALHEFVTREGPQQD